MTDKEEKESNWRSSSSSNSKPNRGNKWNYGNKSNRNKYYKQDYQDNKFGKRTFNRTWSNSQNDGKRPKLQVGQRLKEPDVGITEFIGDHLGISGIVKERYSDFHVNEIDINGGIVKLTHQNIPPKLEESEDIKTLKELIPESVWNQLQTLQEIDASTPVIEIDVTNMDKSQRRVIHSIAKKMSNITSQTVDRDDKKIMMIIPNNKENQKVRREFQRDSRVDWKARGGEYCHFVLHKVNKDTMDALNQLAMNLRIKPNNFTYSGTKDRRAWTTQWVCIRKVEPRQILQSAKNIPGVYVGNFKFAKEPLKLGMLNGNRFKIALRNVTAPDEEIEKTMISLRDNGFLNYYGLQRFGTVAAIPTYEIGKKLLQAKWDDAVELILKPRDGEQDRHLADARAIYAKSKDAYAAYQRIQRLDKIEATLLKGLYLHKNSQNALDWIPRNARLMYIHSYQSFVWNHMVSRRIKEFGTKPIVGDLVYKSDDVTEEIEAEIVDDSQKESDEIKLSQDDEHGSEEVKETDDTKHVREEQLIDESLSNENTEANVEKTEQSITDTMKEVMVATECNLKINESVEQEKPNNGKQDQELYELPAVKILTEEDLPNYTLADVIMPQPGWKVTYPPYAKPWFDEFLAKDDLTADLRQKNKKYSLGGSYRKMLQIPSDLSWKIMHYQEMYDNLIISDLEEMKKLTPPADKPDGQKKALIVEISLRSSSYATMALREIIKSDTSAQVQAAQSAAQAETDAAESSATIPADEKQVVEDEKQVVEDEKRDEGDGKQDDVDEDIKKCDDGNESSVDASQKKLGEDDSLNITNTQEENNAEDLSEAATEKSDETQDNLAST